ncbi:butyrophilin-like protein 2 isoform X1 [Trachemys scripta elegans]|uniref:butyrophilin-like protein 2 isoform X1 n=1 Tax=Trachemys scripta elegans TaxID=31138 RepID=UPI00155223D5|nr:butyrophilin-like protein 2 isoform X1 [Trachemys scripta elegans]XP_034613366.1 butyrophilin-like protein 2 isoform X1 [Trachemys scripta elegans]
MDSLFPSVTTIQLLIFLQIPHLATGQFTIHTPDNIVIGVAGEDAILPCYLSSPRVPLSTGVQWTLARPLERIEVTFYNGGAQTERQGEGYQGRTEFFTSQLSKGNLSLKLKNIQVTDKGKYACQVDVSDWHGEAYIELDVTAPYRILPSNPVIGVIGADVILPCQLSVTKLPGSFEVQWKLFRPAVLIHEVSYNGGNQTETQGERHQGRTELSITEMTQGNLSLKLKHVQISDKAEYVCSLDSGSWYDETVVELDVTGRFKIFPPSNPVIRAIGEDVVLPCQLSATIIPASITVQWILIQPSRKPVKIFNNRRFIEDRQDERSWGGMELFSTEWTKGNMSLKLNNVQLPDRGKYVCSVAAGDWYDKVAIELEVTGPQLCKRRKTWFSRSYVDNREGMALSSAGHQRLDPQRGLGLSFAEPPS